MTIASNLKKLAFLSLLTMGFAACGQTGSLTAGDKVRSNSKAGDPSTPAQTALLASGDPQAVIANAGRSLATQKAYRVRSTSVVSAGGGQTRTSVREVVTPDRSHDIEDGREVIIIGKVMYIKKGGQWRNMGTQMSDMVEKMKARVQQLSPEEKAEATKGLSGGGYKALGDEMLDGISTAVYETHSKLDPKMEGIPTIETVTKYWIGKSDGLFHKEESSGDEAGMKIKTTKMYEYDPNITIEAPLP